MFVIMMASVATIKSLLKGYLRKLHSLIYRERAVQFLLSIAPRYF